ncbi:kinase-like protein [Dacryopinax primogenitus]|uniref:Kinase-like protein n=1 Tax=Dacryopinax primogenitus (strain DJM 731) TaxID=1858805 RepID=M5FZ27_DACPD|nr:kinase-like protein [Dacryopinax primogenitus]EJU01140.1 kinase-like protein [Dacryopinax primogenitus]
MSTPTLGPSLPLDLPTPPPLHLSSSYTSVISIGGGYADSRSRARSESQTRWQLDVEQDEPELREYQLKDLPYADVELDARKHRSPNFATVLLSLFRTLRIPGWSSHRLTPANVHLQKISGALTNAVFFVSYPQAPKPPTLVLRIYGPSSSVLISRPSELQTLHILSSQYSIGPKVYGTFANGRVEQYFPSRTLTAAEMREPQMSQWIGMRMRELHSVDLERVVQDDISLPGVWKNITSWLVPARDVLGLLAKVPLPLQHKWANISTDIDLHRFAQDVSTYQALISSRTPPVVFAHNDAQYGNLLRLTKPLRTPSSSPLAGATLPPQHQLIVVDFEYASPNPAAFDIANHFHEWCFDYSRPVETSWYLERANYPTLGKRRNFYRAYLGHSATEEQLDQLEREVREWSPASHAMWAVWGLVQARDDVIGLVNEGVKAEGGDFNYLRYARGRMEWFYRELQDLIQLEKPQLA